MMLPSFQLIFTLKNSGLLSKYTSVTFKMLAFITLYVCICTEKKKYMNKIIFFNWGPLVELTQTDPKYYRRRH